MNSKFLLLLLLLPVAAPAQSPHVQSDFPPEEFRARWERLFDRIGDEAVALVQGAPSARGYEYPRQSNNFYYLTGVETPHAYLWLDGRTREVTLFLPPANEKLERSEGKVLSAGTPDLAMRVTGVDAVRSTEVAAGRGAP